MICRICNNTERNNTLLVKELQHCSRESFLYFQCSNCGCIQIGTIPANIGEYYPSDYYSFNRQDADKFLQKKMNYFKRIQVQYIIDGRPKLLGKLFTLGYRHAMLFDWLSNLKLHKDDYVLDIGSGDGDELKRMYQLGFRNLTGVDPFIPRDYHFTETFNIYKKDPLSLNNESSFDCIMMHHSLEHMENQKEVLKHIKYLLKPGGKVLIRIPVVSEPLLKRYGSNLVSLDAPRHIYIHSLKSMQMLCHEVGFKIQQIAFDAEEFSFWASEQYAKGICLNAPNSYARSRETSMFTKDMIKEFKKQITELNHKGESDNAAFYLNLL